MSASGRGPGASVSRKGRGRRRRHTPRRTPQDNVRVSAAWILDRTLASSAPVDNFLAGVLERFEPRDRGLLRELVLGSLRWLRRLDHVIAEASHRRFEEIERALRAPLRIGAYQLLFLDRIPSYAAVDEAVEQARSLTHRGGASFVNAVLRRIARSPSLEEWPVEEEDEIRRVGIELSHPDLLVRRWVDRFGWDRTRSILAANNESKPLQLLAFRDRGGRELLAEELIDEGYGIEPTTLSPLGITVREGDPLESEAFARGDFYIQDEASQAAALVPPPEGEESILDLAAAPGGKSFALRAWEGDLDIVACDVSMARLAIMGANLVRLRRTIPLVAADAGEPPFRRRFDRVVVDLPCSGTGTLRKNPELKWRITAEEVDRLARAGYRMLRGGAGAVVSGGTLVAITCSLEREENEAVVERFLGRNRDFEAVALDEILPRPLDEGVEARGRWRVFPGGPHDGFTVHALRRREA